MNALLCLTILAIAKAPPPSVTATPVLHIRIDGDGFLRFAREGEVVYAKEASLTVVSGRLATPSGEWIVPPVRISTIPEAITIDLQGRVLFTTRGQGLPTASTEVGRLVLAAFPEDLRPVASGPFVKFFGPATLGEPGEGLFGVVRTNAPAASTIIDPTRPRMAPPEPSSVQVSIDTRPAPAPKPAPTIAEKIGPYTPDPEFIQKGGVEIVFTDIVEVTADRVKLADIALVFAESPLRENILKLDVTNTPPFGVDRVIDRTVIASRLRQAGVAGTRAKIVGPLQVRVRRAGQVITHDQFLVAAEAAVTMDFPGFRAVSQGQVSPLRAPLGQLDLRAERVTRAGSSVTVVVAAFVDGKRVNSRSVTLTGASLPASFKIGDSIPVAFVSNGVRVEANGTIRRLDRVTGQITVELGTGRTITGSLSPAGIVEVKL